MATGGGGSNVVFVGNIPYTASEEQLQEVFEAVGPVISFRYMHQSTRARCGTRSRVLHTCVGGRAPYSSTAPRC